MVGFRDTELKFDPTKSGVPSNRSFSPGQTATQEYSFLLDPVPRPTWAVHFQKAWLHLGYDVAMVDFDHERVVIHLTDGQQTTKLIKDLFDSVRQANEADFQATDPSGARKRVLELQRQARVSHMHSLLP